MRDVAITSAQLKQVCCLFWSGNCAPIATQGKQQTFFMVIFMSREGYIYILSNKAMHGLVKIGRSVNGGEERARSLYSSGGTGMPYEFKLEFEIFSTDIIHDERDIHRELAEFRVPTGKEFFHVPIAHAIVTACRIVLWNNGVNIYEPDYIENDIRVGRACERNEIHAINTKIDHSKISPIIDECFGAKDKNLPPNSLIVYSYIKNIISNVTTISIDGDKFSLIGRDDIVAGLDFLNMKPDTAYRHLKVLDRANAIEYKKHDGKDCVRLVNDGSSTREESSYQMV